LLDNERNTEPEIICEIKTKYILRLGIAMQSHLKNRILSTQPLYLFQDGQYLKNLILILYMYHTHFFQETIETGIIINWP
jgi:hypothetical protein